MYLLLIFYSTKCGPYGSNHALNGFSMYLVNDFGQYLHQDWDPCSFNGKSLNQRRHHRHKDFTKMGYIDSLLRPFPLEHIIVRIKQIPKQMVLKLMNDNLDYPLIHLQKLRNLLIKPIVIHESW